ncbi:uncharacterized protein LOC111986046 [Quercus suber]|uniref:uncharacterized protein LOC111986046 n=1 Tax=Quercus suber TaxID=58331 RepID=UPI000CE1CE51|nr:uncharacterized protein LOC111986046 [Quercus suber]POE84595.1 uncharacterized protein CFP56_70684 [Quercus suber]
MERERLKRSEEEEDTLRRSTKKFKDSHHVGGSNGQTSIATHSSYRDKLLGTIPGAFEQAFGFESVMQEDVQSNTEEENLHEGCTKVCFSKEEKARMRALWQHALLIKPFGRKVGFLYLDSKIRSMWNPVGKMDCIDLGLDYFLVKFELADDMDNILKGGLWFISQHFLAIRQWEPGFKASMATFSSVAVWVRLPELPIEFYEPATLLKIGKSIEPVLRIDSHTINGTRGRFARLCIQVNLDKPLIRTVYIGKIAQSILYKGISSLCFSCGRIGHKKESCPYTVKEPNKESNKETDKVQNTCSNTNVSADLQPGRSKAEGSKEEYGEWMVVTRRKPFNKATAKPMV